MSETQTKDYAGRDIGGDAGGRTGAGVASVERGVGGDGAELTVPCKVCGGPIQLPGVASLWGRKLPSLLCVVCCEANKRQQEEQARQAMAMARAKALEAVRVDLPAALASCGVAVRWREAAFDVCPDVPADLRRAVVAWTERPAGILYLFGVPGAGKTWLAVAALRAMLSAGVYHPRACRFLGEREFLDSIKATFGNGNGPTSPRAMPSNSPYRVGLLLYDDLGASRLTDWSRDVVSGLVEFRHANGLPTIITANLSPDGLAAAVDGRILSRIAEGRCMYEFPARDLRVFGSLLPTAVATSEQGRTGSTNERSDTQWRA